MKVHVYIFKTLISINLCITIASALPIGLTLFFTIVISVPTPLKLMLKPRLEKVVSFWIKLKSVSPEFLVRVMVHEF